MKAVLEFPFARIFLLIAGTALLFTITYKTLEPNDDPHRCRAVLQTGHWADPDTKHHVGDGLPFRKWRPNGCLLHDYNGEEIRQCLRGRTVMFFGDSTVRQVTYATSVKVRAIEWRSPARRAAEMM